MYAWSVISNNAVRNLSVVLSLCTVLVACARPDAAWEEARRLDTSDGYASYQERHPRSPHAAEARTRREALLAERDWSVARNADTVDAYSEYLRKHPEGLWAGKAKERVTALTATPSVEQATLQDSAEKDAAPSAATPAPTAPSEPIVASTPVAPAAPAKITPPPAPKVLVQFGAFSSAEGAQKAWRELQSRHAALRDLQPVYRRSGKGATGLHLLKAGVATRADAEKLCRALQAAGQACLIS
jgi:hypothetical protein